MKQPGIKSHLAFSRNVVFLTGLLSFTLIFLTISATAQASVQQDLDHLARALENTVWRLESGIELAQQKQDDFLSIAARQYELTVLGAGQPQLLEEDYYRLGLSLIARHFSDYQLAKQLLQQELTAQTLRAVRAWLLKEIADLDKLITSQKPDQHNIKPRAHRNFRSIIADLKQTLAAAGVR